MNLILSQEKWSKMQRIMRKHHASIEKCIITMLRCPWTVPSCNIHIQGSPCKHKQSNWLRWEQLRVQVKAIEEELGRVIRIDKSAAKCVWTGAKVKTQSNRRTQNSVALIWLKLLWIDMFHYLLCSPPLLFIGRLTWRTLTFMVAIESTGPASDRKFEGTRPRTPFTSPRKKPSSSMSP